MTTAPSADRRRRRRLLILAGLLTLWLAGPPLLRAQNSLEEQVRLIAAELRCPVCQNLSVAESSSELAQEMRALIREQVKAGKTPEEIRAYFVSKYGDWILLSPRARGLGLLLWIGPFAAALIGLATALVVVRGWARRSRLRERPPSDPALVERVRHEAFGDVTDAMAAELEDLSPLELERNSLYAAIRELDFDHRSGKLSKTDYQAMRQEHELRAASVLRELEQSQRPPAGTQAVSAPVRGPAPERRAPERPRPLRPWRLAATAVFLLAFGVSLGYFLSQSVRPRLSEQDSITGDALTGTGPGARQGPVRDAPGLIASGRAAYERQDWGTAIAAFKQALALNPANPEALTLVGVVLLHGGHAEEALRTIDRALAVNPRYPLALWSKGLVLFEHRQDYRGAIETWETLMAESLAPRDADKVARMIAEARRRLTAPRTVPDPASSSTSAMP